MGAGFSTVKGMAGKVLGTNPGAVIGNVVNVAGAAYTFNDSRSQGDSVGVSVAKTGADFAFGELMSGFGLKGMLAYAAITTGYELSLGMAKANAESQGRMAGTGSGRMGSGYFNMSGAGYTMRQRGMNQIRSNGQNVQSVLGNEARNYLHASRDYT